MPGRNSEQDLPTPFPGIKQHDRKQTGKTCALKGVDRFFCGEMIGIRHPVYHNVDRKTRVEPDGRRLVKMTEIGEETLKQYRGYLADREKSIATIDKYLRDIRTFLQWM